MTAIKSNILNRMDAAPTSVRVCVIKFIQKVVQVQTPGVIADPRVQLHPCHLLQQLISPDADGEIASRQERNIHHFGSSKRPTNVHSNSGGRGIGLAGSAPPRFPGELEVSEPSILLSQVVANWPEAILSLLTQPSTAWRS
jgi:Symplekin/PTA1 N-terminal